MNLLTNDFRASLSSAHESPCLSLYQPTHRHHPDNQEDPIRFRNLVKQLDQSLQKKYSTQEIRVLLEPFEALSRDHDFWNHTLDGLAVFGAPGLFQVFGLQRTTRELAVVADSFHTKPLLSFLQSADRFQVLALNLREIKLFEGNRDSLDEIALAPGVPRTLTEALGEELTEPHQTVASYGGTGGGSVAMRHGHGDKKDEMDSDEKRFFHRVDRAILESHSQASGLPLILAALPEHQGHFRKHSQNSFLLDEGIKVHPDALPMTEFRERAWHIFQPQYQARLAKLADEFAVAKSKGLGQEDVKQVAVAAVAGQIATLLLEADRQIPGRIDGATGEVEFKDLSHPEVDDLLDDLGELVFKTGGRVVVVPADRMPTMTGVAATCRSIPAD
ncbi:MAG: hypothetical protein SH820_14175 [Xanthomonadales bacterium]|nr:hypothetical protein [Xanthomonadales bacterium]